MYVKSIKDIESVSVGQKSSGANNVSRQVLISPEQGWQGWVMRLFTLGADGHSPRHAHPWPHIVFVHSGKGTIWIDGKDYEVQAEYVAVVPANSEHQFANRGQEEFSFVCIVPEEGNV